MEYNKPRVTLEIAQDPDEFAKCCYPVKNVNDSYGVMILLPDGYAITCTGSPGEKKRTATPVCMERCRLRAIEILSEK